MRLFRATGWGVAQAVMLSLNGVAASWLPDTAKQTLARQFETEIAALQAALA